MIGFDYGTSNCAIGVFDGNKSQVVDLQGHGPYMASALYAPSRDIIVNHLQQQLPEPQRSEFIKQRAYLLQQGQQELTELRLDGIATDLSFGKHALSQYLDDPSEGYYIKSPKSFLGSTGLLPQQIAFFEHIVAAMMAHVKSLAEQRLQRDLTQVVIGRPVNFQGRHGEESNRQAIQVLTNAATLVGYKDIEFQFEPVAAGFEFEASLSQDSLVLVIDIGGGTTDCSMLKMGPSYIDKVDRKDELLGHTGRRIGGNDFDIQLALKTLMPNLGLESQLKSGKPMPVNSYHEAVAINNVFAQTEFYSAKNGRFLADLLLDAQQPELLSRLIKVYKNKLSYQLVNSAEQTKIALTDKALCQVDLSYLDNDLSQTIDQNELGLSAQRELNAITELAFEVIDQAGAQPQVIFVTGGTAKSPMIHNHLQQAFNDLPIIIGDHFGSVTSGLARWAHRIYC